MSLFVFVFVFVFLIVFVFVSVFVIVSTALILFVFVFAFAFVFVFVIVPVFAFKLICALLILVVCLLQQLLFSSNQVYLSPYLFSNIYVPNLPKKQLFVKSACDEIYCYNGGTCQSGFTVKGYRCLCPPGFKGKRCQKGRKSSIHQVLFYFCYHMF